MSGFGDADPEDGWDDGDTLNQKLVILGMVLIAVTNDPDQARVLLRLAWARHKLEELTGG